MKTLSTAAQAAKSIRKELKAAFPHMKFRVRSENFSLGNSVDISWENGPTEAEVEKITSKYQMGHFDGMTDYYELSNMRRDVPQAKFVHCHRSISQDVYDRAFIFGNEILAPFGEVLTMDEYSQRLGGTARQKLWRYLLKIDLSKGLTMEEFRNAVFH